MRQSTGAADSTSPEVGPGLTADCGGDSADLSVFLSYARADRPTVTKLAAVLERGGFDLWWDALIEGGASFARRIETALEKADAVVVAWSAASVDSDWVRDEASHGRDSARLVPISLDGTPPPLGFRQYHFIDFSKWNGGAGAREVTELFAAIRLVGRGESLRAEPAPRAPSRTMSRRRMIAATGVVTAVAVTGGYFGVSRWTGAATANSIAVLPFVNRSGDPAQGYFSDGLSDDLRARLGREGKLHVAAQTSSNLFRDRKVDAKAAATQLGVAFLLDGSVQRAGTALRIVSELIEASTGLSRWSDSFDRQIADVFAVQAEIAGRVSNAVLGQLVPVAQAHATAPGGTSSVTAYDYYLKGREQYELDVDENSNRKAVAFFDQAIAEDPAYAMAYAARSAAITAIAGNYVIPAQQKAVYARARADGEKAASLAPDLAEAQYAIANAINFGELNFHKAQSYFERARALGGNNALIQEQYGYFASHQARNAEAIAAIDKAISLDPLNPLMVRARGRILLGAGQLDEAIRVLRRARVMNPKLQNTSSAIGYALLLQHKFDDARQAFVAELKETERLTGLAIIEEKLGNHATAEAQLAKLIAGNGDLVLYQQAQIAAQWGRIDQAITLLERAYAANDSGLTWTANDPMLRPLAGNARYLAVLGKLGLQ